MTRFIRGTMRTDGWVDIWAVDEHGCLLHSEPICIVPPKWHAWFLDWIEKQKCPIEFPPLLWHPALGETLESYQEERRDEQT